MADVDPNRSMTATAPFSLGRETLASVVVFLVALPLCMGIAIASGVPPARGLFSGIIGGIIVGLFAGSPLQVSGPAAGLAVVVWQLVERYGLEALGVAVFFAGLLQLAAGGLKIGRWFRAVAPAVVKGMLSGIGVLILASQAHVMVDDAPTGSGLANLLAIPSAILKGLVDVEHTAHHEAAQVGMITLLVIVAWNFLPEKLAALRRVPGPLAAVIIGTAAAALLGHDIAKVSVPDSLFDAIALPKSSTLDLLADKDYLLTIVTLAAIASAETLLCCVAVDQLHDGQRTDYDKELVAQGIGNTLAGLIGALPITGVIVRSSANVEAGATTRWSAVMHGFWLLLLCGLFPSVLSHVPRSGLAAILVYTGWKLLDVNGARKLWAFHRAEFMTWLVTVTIIVTVDLLTGVVLGLGLAAVRLVWIFSRIEIDVDDVGDRIDVDLHGAATFLALPRIAATLEELPPNREVHVHIGGLAWVDHACLELLSSWERQYDNLGGDAVIEWDELKQRYHAGMARQQTAVAAMTERRRTGSSEMPMARVARNLAARISGQHEPTPAEAQEPEEAATSAKDA